MKTKSKAFKIIDKIFTIFLLVFFVTTLFLSVLFTVYRAQNKMIRVFGYSICYVVTPSMIPTLNVSDVILIQNVPAEEVQVQDIITYQSTQGVLSGQFITHRVIAINNETDTIIFTTKGDANNAADTEVVTENKLQGVFVRKLVVIKLLISALSNVYVFLIIIILPLFILLTVQVVHFVTALKDKDKNKEIDKDKEIDQEIDNDKNE